MENAATLIISIIILVLLIIVIVIIICCGKENNNSDQNKNNFCTLFQGFSTQCCGVPNDKGKSCKYTKGTDNGKPIYYTGLCVNYVCQSQW
jgi:hypothetical protein